MPRSPIGRIPRACLITVQPALVRLGSAAFGSLGTAGDIYAVSRCASPYRCYAFL